MFFVLDLLSFGFSVALVLFVVACSMPRHIGAQSAKYAGLIWLTLVMAFSLLALAVASGVGALVAGVLAVYPTQYLQDVWGTIGAMLIMAVLAFWALVVRWMAIFPGWAALQAGLVHVREEAVQSLALIGRCVLLCLQTAAHQISSTPQLLCRQAAVSWAKLCATAGPLCGTCARLLDGCQQAATSHVIAMHAWKPDQGLPSQQQPGAIG